MYIVDMVHCQEYCVVATKTRRMSIVYNRTIAFGGKGGTLLDVATHREWNGTHIVIVCFTTTTPPLPHPSLSPSPMPPYSTFANRSIFDRRHRPSAHTQIYTSWPVPICPGRIVQNLAFHILLASINRIRSLQNISGPFSHTRKSATQYSLSQIAIQPNRNIFSGCAQYVMMMVHIVSVVGQFVYALVQSSRYVFGML